MGKFTFDFQPAHLKAVIGNNKYLDSWYDALVDVLPDYNINTPERVAMFLAQCAHESGKFRVFKENLNYSAEGLNEVFPKYFKRAGRDAQDYHRQPEKIANVVYANRMDNGDTASGDGWRFRGRGLIQLTGRHNYTRFAKDTGMDLYEVPDYLETFAGAVESACWYWNTNGLNRYADSGDIKGATKRINGGYIGLEDRKHHWEDALNIMGADPSSFDDVVSYETVRKGSRVATVKAMQKALGITADGDFGPGTERALKAWQSANGLTADGIAGPATLGKLL